MSNSNLDIKFDNLKFINLSRQQLTQVNLSVLEGLEKKMILVLK